MKVLVAMDSFKGSISSSDSGRAVSDGVKKVYPDAKVISLPLADGGEGTTEALINATNGETVHVKVTGPLGDKVDASYGLIHDGKVAVIEIAAACGLPLLGSDQLNPLKTTTYGVGELIIDAMEKGCREFIIGLGGSATNDAGIGMLQALGFQFLDSNHHELGFGGEKLTKIERIKTDLAHKKLKECTFRIACDVDNVLYGENGAAYIFGPQKGANHVEIQQLDEGLKHFAQVVETDLSIDMKHLKGGGAAGGLGAAFHAFLNGTLESGIELVLQYVVIDQYLSDVDFVITGEGKLDSQTALGKVPIGVAKAARKFQIPVIALAGTVTDDATILNELGVHAYFPIIQSPISLKEAMDEQIAYKSMKKTAEQIFRIIRATRKN